MLKTVAIAILGSSLIVCVGSAAAVEMAVTTADFARSGGSSTEIETTTATTSEVGAMREAATRASDADTAAAVHERLQPDSTAVTGSGSTHSLGVDAASSPSGAPAHKRQNAHWQSLLPGVMK